MLINQIELLPQLFGEIHVPTEVMTELRQPRTPAPVKQWADSPPSWLLISTPSASLAAAAHLDPGEAQAIALASELHADAILIDDRKGRRITESLGFNAVTTLAVLEFAAEKNLLDLKSALVALRSTTFYITDEYIDAALLRDATRKPSE